MVKDTNKKATVKDVAALAHVSTASVSRYLNGVKGHVSKENASKISKAIKLLHYVPNSAARQMVSHESKEIALLVADASDIFSAELFKGASTYLSKKGYTTVLFDSSSNKDREMSLLDTIHNSSFDGLLYQPLNSNLSSLKFDVIRNIPLVVIDRRIMDKNICQVVSTNYQSASKITKIYKDKGFENVIIISSPIYDVSTRLQRLKGIESQIDISNIHILETTLNIHSLKNKENRSKLYSQIQSLLIPGKKNLLFFLEERFLMASLPFLIKLNQDNQSNIAITGFIDSDYPSWIFPNSNFIKQQPFEMGHQSATLLIKLIKGKTDSTKCITVNNEIVYR